MAFSPVTGSVGGGVLVGPKDIGVNPPVVSVGEMEVSSTPQAEIADNSKIDTSVIWMKYWGSCQGRLCKIIRFREGRTTRSG